MKLEEFRKRIRGKSPQKLADEFLRADMVTAFATVDRYAEFREAVKSTYANAEHVVVAGTANWNFSLNPGKYFKVFDEASDVDTVVISLKHFTDAWDQLRNYHRTRGHTLPRETQDLLRRNGENVYSGFVSPLWIPDRSNQFRYSHERVLNALSDQKVNFRPVNMFFFRHWVEAVDYYSRGFRIAQGNT